MKRLNQSKTSAVEVGEEDLILGFGKTDKEYILN